MEKNEPMKPNETTCLHSCGTGMKYCPSYRFCRWDGMVLLVVLVLAGAVALGLYGAARSSRSFSGHLEAVLTVNGEEVWSVNLSELSSPIEYTVNGTSEQLIVLAEDGKVRVLSSTCTDQVCVHSGWLSETGQTAVCLPYRVILKVEGVTETGDLSSDTNVSYDVISR